MTTFVDDDQGYLSWVEAHPEGYVVNCGRTPTPNYLMLHRAGCKSIKTSARANWTTGDYMKVCSEKLADLERWASEKVGGKLQPCRACSSTKESSRRPGGGGSSNGRRIGVDEIKKYVELAAALFAVIGGIVAFIQWAF